jgi:hypothetical protein
MTAPMQPTPPIDQLLRRLAQLTGAGANHTQSQQGIAGQASAVQRGGALGDVLEQRDKVPLGLDEQQEKYHQRYNDLSDKATLIDDMNTSAEISAPSGSGRFYGRLDDPGQTADGGWPTENGKRGENKYGGTAERDFKATRLAQLQAMMDRLKSVGR